MAVRIEGLPDPLNLTTYSVTEDATGLNPETPSGGFGQIQFTAIDWPNSKMLSRSDITLVDSVHGRITGTVQNVTPDGATVSVTGDSELGKFNARRVALPFSGPMSEYVQYLMDLSGLYATLDYQAQDYTIHVPGFTDNVWERVKLLMSAHQLELTLVGDVVVVREPLLVESTLENAVALSTAVNRQTSSLAVDVRYYNYRPISKGEVYPVRGEEPSIQTVEAGQTIEFELNINASLTEVYQPVPSLNVGPGDRSGTQGVYTIVGQDDLPVMPAQWRAAGGRLDVYLTDEPGVLRCVLMGAQIPHLAPFRIAESAGGTDYNSLHITGDGVAWDANAVRLYTGADPMVAAEEVGAEVDNPYISTPSQAVATGAITAAAHSGADVEISGTLAKADDHPQAFGNLIGSRVFHDGAYYRIETTSYGPGGVSFGGSMATTIADFNEVWAGKTQAEFNAVWEDYDAGQFSMMPLNYPEPQAQDDRLESIAGEPILLTQKAGVRNLTGDLTLVVAAVDGPNPADANNWFYLFDATGFGSLHRRQFDSRIQRSTTLISPFGGGGAEPFWGTARFTRTEAQSFGLGMNARGGENWVYPWVAAVYDRHLTDSEAIRVAEWLRRRYGI